MIYKFKKPFKYENETVDTVELKEDYNAGDLIRIVNAKGEGDKVGAILVAATGWPLPKVSKIHILDAMAMNGIITSFLGLGDETGAET